MFLKLCLFAIFGFLPMAAQAANTQSGWMGVNAGISVPSASGATARPIYGINAGGKIGSEFGVGGYYLTSTKSETISNVTANFGYDLYGVEFSYHFEGEAQGVNFGGRLGMTKTTFGSTGLSTSPMHYGAFIGFNKFFGSAFSVGGELSYLVIPSSTTNNTTLDGFSALNFIAAAKLWF